VRDQVLVCVSRLWNLVMLGSENNWYFEFRFGGSWRVVTFGTHLSVDVNLLSVGLKKCAYISFVKFITADLTL
jgi:hypothetical protein